MKRNSKRAIIVLGVVSLTSTFSYSYIKNNNTQKPNVIFIYADDLGRGMLSHYGQQYFSTPNIDRIFKKGTSFEYAYGCQFSAPSRASLLTGYHDCHQDKWKISNGGIFKRGRIADVIDSLEVEINSNDIPLADSDLHLSQVFKRAGYTTGEVGKLEWGFTTTRDQMKSHEWDYYYGYLDHVRCHGYYPQFLFENGNIVGIEGNTHMDCAKAYEEETPENYTKRWDMKGKSVYSESLFIERILDFIDTNKSTPFFLYYPSQLPHGPVSVPAVHPELKDVEGLTELEKEYASMVKMLDDHVGIILNRLEELGILDNTIIIFSSDNGHETYYTNDTNCLKMPERDTCERRLDPWSYPYTSERVGDKFDGNNGMTGKKWSNLEGGVRVPLAFMCEGCIRENFVSRQLSANYDLLTTFADMLGVRLKVKKDGVSLTPILFKDKDLLSKKRYVFVNSPLGNSVIDSDGWKLSHNEKLNEYRLYYLPDDYTESNPLVNSSKFEELKKALGSLR